MNLQRTLKKEVSLTGIGIHSGQPVPIRIRPALPNQGIVFVRTDLPGSPEILAHFENVVSTQMATTLGKGKATVSTVEHILAAFQCLNIDNARVEVPGPEVPIMDGSSAPFCDAILSAGIESQAVFRPFLVLKKKIELKLAEKWAVAEPASRLEIQGSIEWDHPAIGHQEFLYQEGRTSYRELVSARTFGFLKDFENLKRLGLARGASLENAVGLDEASVLNPEGLRFPNEFVRHKVLDALGDLKLAGIGIHAMIRLHRAGHDLHRQLLVEIFKDPDNYEIVGALEEEVELGLQALLVQGYAVG